MATKRYFGTDGIRGKVGIAPMTPDILVRLGFVSGRVLAAGGGAGVLIGKDTRRSGYMIEAALEAGFAAAGVKTFLTGPLPTSAVSYLTQTLRLDAGVVISASHNPHDDNGIKFFGGDGAKIAADAEREIERQMTNTAPLAFDGEPGHAERLPDAAGRYIEFCKRAFPPHLNLRGLRVVVDCANGAAYHVAPPVLHELGAEVIAVGDKPDGFNINKQCGAMAPAAAAALVRKHGAAAGLALDGDGDRLILMDEKGKIHDGDALLYLLLNDMLTKKQQVDGVVGTVLSNGALEEYVRRRGIGFFRCDVGDKHVIAALRRFRWQLGGEPAGHIILPQVHNTGDGLITALRVLAAAAADKPLSEMLRDYRPMPQSRRDIKVKDRKRAMMILKKAKPEVLAGLGDGGRVVVRLSGTEDVVRIMTEARRASAAKAAADALSGQIGHIGR
ncbi:MAG: phosphoglucosamine mutase [Gammaproteobacteria bacterium]